MYLTEEGEKRLKIKDKTAEEKYYSLFKHRRGKLELARAGAGQEFIHRVVTGTREGKSIYR